MKPVADEAASIARLEAELLATPRETRPYEHALVAHRLGLARAEAASGSSTDDLRRSLANFDAAAALLDPRYHPVEHGRVLTAAGSVQRSLGEPNRALELFIRAARLTTGRVSDDEAAAMHNNIGLALLEVGDHLRAIERFNQAVAMFDVGTAGGRRGMAAALHNRGLARAASGRPEDLVAAIVDHDLALEAVGFEEAPLHHGLVHQSRGVAAAAMAAADPEAAATWRQAATASFTSALDVFTWPDHPMHHGIVSYNLGRIRAAGASIVGCQQAVVCFEDAVTAFDPRRQAAPWRQAYDALAEAEQLLAIEHPGWTRTDHVVALLHADPSGAQRLIRRRLVRWLASPLPARAAALTDFVRAIMRAEWQIGCEALVLLLSTVMELPLEAQTAVFDALVTVRSAADRTGREVIDRLVDRAIADALNGPQRVFVRDHLTSGGFERP